MRGVVLPDGDPFKRKTGVCIHFYNPADDGFCAISVVVNKANNMINSVCFMGLCLVKK